MPTFKFPALQVALDFINLTRALKVAEEAHAGGCDWIEAGTPLIKSEGLNAVRSLRKMFPRSIVVADMKIMDAGRIEVESAAKAGADIVCVLAAATDATIKECVNAASNYGTKIEVDLIGAKDPAREAKRVESLGANFIGVHCAIDEQMEGKIPIAQLKKISGAVRIPVAVAGGVNSETAALCIKAGASVVIVGGAITKSIDPRKAARDLKKAITQDIKIKSQYFKRAKSGSVSKIFKIVSTANISDAMHRGGDLLGIYPISSGAKMSGKILTVRTYPGDWAKTVEAVDLAEEGDVIAIDAGGSSSAVWGELATHGAIQKKIAGVIIDGAVRDVASIKKLKFPVFARTVAPRAGEPKGFGEIGLPITIGGRKIFTGDWALGDDDGVCIVPADKVVEIANRAMNIFEQENRLRKEIDEGSTLAKVAELLRWEKQK